MLRSLIIDLFTQGYSYLSIKMFTNTNSKLMNAQLQQHKHCGQSLE